MFFTIAEKGKEITTVSQMQRLATDVFEGFSEQQPIFKEIRKIIIEDMEFTLDVEFYEKYKVPVYKVKCNELEIDVHYYKNLIIESVVVRPMENHKLHGQNIMGLADKEFLKEKFREFIDQNYIPAEKLNENRNKRNKTGA